MVVGDLILNRNNELGIILEICDVSPQPYKCKFFTEKMPTRFLAEGLAYEYKQRYLVFEEIILDKKSL
jgi:hypothetical protein